MRVNHCLPVAALLALSLMAFSCAPGHSPSVDVPAPAADLAPTTQPAQRQTLVVAGGCFWCTETVCQHVKGVTGVVSGYTGGSRETATYEQVSNGNTGHAEAVQITYDPTQITFGQLLQIYFSSIDPTTMNAQGPDHGTQYRSAIFYQTPEQKQVIEAYIKQLDDAHVFARPIVTAVEPLKAFYPAEQYHQDYVERHPNAPYVVQNALPKVEKLKKHFPGLYREE